MNPLTYSHKRLLSACNQRTSVIVLLVSWIYIYPQWVKCVSVWGQTRAAFCYGWRSVDADPPHFPIVLLPDTCCEALKHNYTAEVSAIHTNVHTHIHTQRGTWFAVPGETPLSWVWMPRETQQRKRNVSEREKRVSEQIKYAWLCFSWRNNECPHSLPVTSGNSWDKV